LQRFWFIFMICSDLHSALAGFIDRYDPEQVCVLYDQNISLPTDIAGLFSRSIAVCEANKSLETIQHIWDFLFEHHITRRGLLICIGGGILTDLGGFAAATYKRGIDYVNVPTTLLAMVDASSGGKTGFNYRGLKNAIGAFYPPKETIIWPGWLTTLPANEFLSGFAEMLKTGLVEPSADGIQDSDRLWNRLLQYDLDLIDIGQLTPLIKTCVRAKEQIVASDPYEHGLRKALNLGHTFGHALEELSIGNRQSSNSPLLHGYAVLYGMIAELYLSVTKLGCPKEPLQQLTQLMLHFYGRPNCKCSDREQLIALMQQDKKNERTALINCTLIRSVGSPAINQIISPAEANEALDYLFSL